MTNGSKLLSRWLRSQGHGSVTRLATKLGITQPAVSSWATGKTRPQVVFRDAIARLTGIPAATWSDRDEREQQDRLAKLAGTGTEG